MADRHKAAQGGVPSGRADYLPDSRILTPADKAEREALLRAFGANLPRARLTAGMTQRELAARADIANVSVISPARGRALAESASPRTSRSKQATYSCLASCSVLRGD